MIAETERAVLHKLPHALIYFRQTINSPGVQIVRDPLPNEVQLHSGLISDATDVPIVLAATNAGVDYLVRLNRRHFIDGPQVAVRLGLRFGTPSDALAWFRARHI